MTASAHAISRSTLAALPRAAGTQDLRGRRLQDLRISVTDRCNFRCPYCMPADAFPNQQEFLARSCMLSFEEIVRAARAAASLGVRKFRITGGEPLLRRGLPTLVYMLARIPGVDDLALTTNGSLLPTHAAALRHAGLKRITISLDALDSQAFATLSGGRACVEEVLRGIEAAQAAGFEQIKVNCVVVRGVNDHGIVNLAAHFKGSGVIVRFIEFMDVGTLNRWRHESVVPSAEVLERIGARFPLRPLDPGYPGEVASRYAYADGSGEIGVIASVTRPFCGGCSRLRLSADGKLYTCLFADAGHDLRALLRGGACQEEAEQFIASIWRHRADRYSEERASVPVSRRAEMYRMGG